MVQVNIHDAKTHFSRLVQPVARLVAWQPSVAPRRLGQSAGQLRIAEDFDTLPDDHGRTLQIVHDQRTRQETETPRC